ncbi:tyrosine-protein phosphatase [Mariniluteicoccus endophyticus]
MTAWLAFDSLVNARDVGGIPTVDGGRIKSLRMLRSDNLQHLTPADIKQLVTFGVTDVVDLRSAYEVHHEGDGPLVGHPGITFHHFSYLPEQEATDLPDHARDAESQAEEAAEEQAMVGSETVGKALPWIGRLPAVEVEDAFASHYLSYLVERPESVVGALRAIGNARGAAIVHCAAGKDRTRTTVALALSLAGAERDAIVADYAASSERMQQIVDKLVASDTYRANLEGRPLSSHLTNPESMDAFLGYAEDRFGGVEEMLRPLGWTDDDTRAVRAHLLND